MHELTHPVELRDQELDLVAAGSSDKHDKCCDGDNTQIGLVNVNDTNIGVNVLCVQVQST